MESTECFERLCKFSEECEYDKDCISGLCSENENICTYPHMCTRDQLYNCNNDQCQELNRRFREYEYDDMKQRCINKSTDITYTDFEINKKTIDLVKGVKQEETADEKKAAKIGLKDSMCNGIPKTVAKGSNRYLGCVGKSYLECLSSYDSSTAPPGSVIPCIWDSESMPAANGSAGASDPAAPPGSCKLITTPGYKFGDFTWEEMSNNLDRFSFFKCPDPNAVTAAETIAGAVEAAVTTAGAATTGS